MASAGAHLTSTVAEGERPSIFELLAQEGLTASLRPALKYAVRILAEKNPVKFGWLYGFGDEIYSLLDLIVEHYYLKHYNASFAENFYGMKRTPVAGGKLTSSARLKSIFYLVCLPYIKEKCDQLYERKAESHGSLSKVERAFLAMYPYIHCIHDGLMLVCQVAYVFGRSSFHSPWLKLAGVMLLSLTEDDIKEQMEPRVRDYSNRSRLSQLLIQSTTALGTLLSGALSVSVFFLHFLEWWYSSEQQSTAAAVTALPTPPPPTPAVLGATVPDTSVSGSAVPGASVSGSSVPGALVPGASVSGASVSGTSGSGSSVSGASVSSSVVSKVAGSNEMCPICRRVRTNHTALAVSGYVFCYPCIFRHIQKVGRCPVTGYPANSDHLIKLYLPDS